MSLDAIRKSIIAEAASKVSAIEGEAEAESSRIVKEAQDNASGIAKRAEEEAKAEALRMKKEGEAGLESETASMITEARGAVVERVLRSVRSGVEKSLAKERMGDILKRSLKQFTVLTGSTDVIIKTNKKNARLVNGSGYKVEYGDIDGFVLYTPDRKIALNATAESIVDREMDHIRKIVSDELFPGSTGKVLQRRAAKASGTVHSAVKRAKGRKPARGRSARKSKAKAESKR